MSAASAGTSSAVDDASGTPAAPCSEGTLEGGVPLPAELQRIPDITVATIGNVDSGKSTLVGVLTKSVLDDGRGYARSKVFNFNHEQENGRTSSIAHEIMGFHTLPGAASSAAAQPGGKWSGSKASIVSSTKNDAAASSPVANPNGSSDANPNGTSTARDDAGGKTSTNTATSDAATRDSESSEARSTTATVSTSASVRDSAASSSSGASTRDTTSTMASVNDTGEDPSRASEASIKGDAPSPTSGGGGPSSSTDANAGGKETKQQRNSKNSNNNAASQTQKFEVVAVDVDRHHGRVVQSGMQKNALWAKIQEQSDRLIQFVDLCGHEKYLKTTIFGLVGLCPDYALVVINANAGLQRMTREHIGIAIALRIPIIIVVTKKDMTPGNVYDANMLNICKVLKSNAVRKMPVLIKHESDVEHAANSILSERIVPVFSVSSVTGDGLPFLRSFLYNLKPRAKELLCRPPSDPRVEFHIESIFLVAGVGVVVAGFMRSGSVQVGSHLYLGPDSLGKYKHLIIRGIHIRRVPKSKAISGDHCSFSLRSVDAKEKFKKQHFRKGMVLLSHINDEPVAFREFEAEIVILHHSTTIRQRYQAVIHCGVIRQSAEVLGMSSELLRTGDKATVRFRFLYHVEYMQLGWTLLFREGRTKGIGRITKLIPAQTADATEPNPNLRRHPGGSTVQASSPAGKSKEEASSSSGARK
ncbi:unnamed protein product [Amoebophrya sp. A25]|nr:unnamed protein product [Amoebophrya sp. A25]|eukprot:GSA25T00015202001.1